MQPKSPQKRSIAQKKNEPEENNKEDMLPKVIPKTMVASESLVKGQIEYFQMDQQHTRLEIELKRSALPNKERGPRAAHIYNDLRSDIIAYEDRFLWESDNVNIYKHIKRRPGDQTNVFEDTAAKIQRMKREEQKLLITKDQLKQKVKKMEAVKDFVDKFCNNSKFRSFGEAIDKYVSLNNQFKILVKKAHLNSEVLRKVTVLRDEWRNNCVRDHCIMRHQITLATKLLSDKSSPREDNKAEDERFAHAQKKMLIETGIRNIANKLMNFREFARVRLKDNSDLIDNLTNISNIVNIYNDIVGDHEHGHKVLVPTKKSPKARSPM